MAAIKDAGHEGCFKIGIDPASSEFFREGDYDLGFKSDTPGRLSSAGLTELYRTLVEKYSIVLLEDPFAQDDWDSWRALHAVSKCSNVELVGDDLLGTNVTCIEKAAEADACDSLLLKSLKLLERPNEPTNLAGQSLYPIGLETTDDFIADLAVGIGCGHLKAGAPCRGERVVKYNRLMDNEGQLQARKIDISYAVESFRYAYTHDESR
ncbi:hypothetical protein LTR96_010898 [Exophiala xenobiotica]|nr:hypothetical protein LTR92_010742 [Exophiala xenobiotica]KAK5203288.1 hypothetical protein LTR41_011012 [Exophiala xenobiotica]KAK5215627.1 hypothetical protein LTR72_011341 [Exophiala xenobiotica]KAK5220246.1 hypothetical protein LTR47_011330 [Exophiala xenobiotica]KAK5244468.1 hypothetical protein LTS06_009952 [Exophiala xenobiotica]